MNMQKDKSKFPAALWAVLFLPVVWLAVLVATGVEGRDGFQDILNGLSEALAAPLDIVWTKHTLRFILAFLFVYAMAVGVYLSSRRNTLPGQEYGSAQWGNAKAVDAKYRQREPHNIILTQNIRLGMDSRKHQLNLNVMVVGGSGSGKSRSYARPNILQLNSSFICSDPKGELLRDTGHILEENGYVVKVLDLIDHDKSHCFNPFAYIRKDEDALKLINNLIKNTTPKDATKGEAFWEKSETALLQALMLYLHHKAMPKDRNFSVVMDMLRCERLREGSDESSFLDGMFAQLEYKDPNHIAVRQYKIYKSGATKTLQSILISLGVRLSAFNLSSIERLTSTDEMELSLMGERKTALFCCTPDNDSSFNFIVGMLYTLAFQELYYMADRVYPNGRLPIHVHCLFDEFAVRP